MIYNAIMKSKTYGIRLTEEQRKKLEKKARKMGMTAAAYIKFISESKVKVSSAE